MTDVKCKVWKNKKISKYGNQQAFFMSITELIKNKRFSNRKLDKVDLEILLRIEENKCLTPKILCLTLENKDNLCYTLY